MRWFRYLSPAYARRLEHEVADLRRQAEGQRRAIRSFAESIGRGSEPGDVAALRSRMTILEQDLETTRRGVGWAIDYLRSGRPDMALSTLGMLANLAATDQREAG